MGQQHYSRANIRSSYLTRTRTSSQQPQSSSKQPASGVATPLQLTQRSQARKRQNGHAWITANPTLYAHSIQRTHKTHTHRLLSIH